VESEGAPALDANQQEDGRKRRRTQNRDAVIDALVTLIGSGRFDASATEIAEHAGISPRSLFRYFDDTDDLLQAAVARHHELARPFLQLDVRPDEPLARRIAAVVVARAQLWDAIEPSARVARMRAPVNPTLAAELARNRALQRAQLQQAFAPELEAMGADEARATLAAVEVLCSFESHDLIRNDQQLPAGVAEMALVRALTALFRPVATDAPTDPATDPGGTPG
jgi:AcrR family transcriptional regulator